VTCTSRNQKVLKTLGIYSRSFLIAYSGALWATNRKFSVKRVWVRLLWKLPPRNTGSRSLAAVKMSFLRCKLASILALHSIPSSIMLGSGTGHDIGWSISKGSSGTSAGPKESKILSDCSAAAGLIRLLPTLSSKKCLERRVVAARRPGDFGKTPTISPKYSKPSIVLLFTATNDLYLFLERRPILKQ